MVGPQVHTTSSQTKNFDGHVLPESFSSFPPNFKIVSFYADPDTLLSTAYVLRKDSWMDEEGLYQRVLIPSKIRNMRKYLTTEKRVFVNNIIVTLPALASLNDPKHPTKNLDPKVLAKATPVSLSVPYEPNKIGIVDGQKPFRIAFPAPVSRVIAVIPRRTLDTRAPWLRNTPLRKIAGSSPYADLTRRHLLCRWRAPWHPSRGVARAAVAPSFAPASS